MKNSQRVEELLSRGVQEILPSKEELKKLMTKRKIRLYLGLEPTAKSLHLGHTVNLRKLQKFAELGHEAILILGTGTVLAGDPSLRESVRPKISKKEIQDNIKGWKGQLAKVIDCSKVKIKHNSDWLAKLYYEDIIDIASNVSIIKLLQREMFERRIKKGGTVWTHEALYPLFQGYDSVALGVDLEIGGTDQTFNMLIGRELMQKMRKKEKLIMTLKMILGTDGFPMSKTRGNCIWLTDSSQEMYGKIMSIPDKLILDYARSLTDLSLQEMNSFSPRQAKSRLAREIVFLYHGKRASLGAEKEFDRVFKDKQLPLHIPTISIEKEPLGLLVLLVKTKLASSKKEAKRLVVQGGLRIDGIVKKEWREEIEVRKGQVLQAGKRKFVRII